MNIRKSKCSKLDVSCIPEGGGGRVLFNFYIVWDCDIFKRTSFMISPDLRV